MKWELDFAPMDEGPPTDDYGWEPIGISGKRVLWKRCWFEHCDATDAEHGLPRLITGCAEYAWTVADEIIGDYARKLTELEEEKRRLEDALRLERSRSYQRGYGAGRYRFFQEQQDAPLLQGL